MLVCCSCRCPCPNPYPELSLFFFFCGPLPLPLSSLLLFFFFTYPHPYPQSYLSFACPLPLPVSLTLHSSLHSSVALTLRYLFLTWHHQPFFFLVLTANDVLLVWAGEASGARSQGKSYFPVISLNIDTRFGLLLYPLLIPFRGSLAKHRRRLFSHQDYSPPFFFDQYQCTLWS